MGGEIGVRNAPGAAAASGPPAARGRRRWTHQPVRARRRPLARARVLLVEDNPVNMMISVAQLEQWGAQVGQAGDGQQAIEAVDQAVRRGEPYDVVLMDLQMPRMGGKEAARALRERYPASELPIIALTAAALVSERQNALQAGMNDFVTAHRSGESCARCPPRCERPQAGLRLDRPPVVKQTWAARRCLGPRNKRRQTSPGALFIVSQWACRCVRTARRRIHLRPGRLSSPRSPAGAQCPLRPVVAGHRRRVARM
jgi:CheY-like chemotaxis protein